MVYQESAVPPAPVHLQGVAEWVTTRDGRRLYSQVLPRPGRSAATVVFEAGAAANRSSWALVQPSVAEFAPAVVYDRSGLGRSASDPATRTLDRLADDLVDVLDHFGSGPFVLVGHSAGGPIVRAAAAQRRHLVSGVVLVDPTDEAADMMFGTGFRRAEKAVIAANALLARVRLLGLLYRRMTDQLPDDARQDMRREGFTPNVVKTQAAQARTFLDDLHMFRTFPPELGELPVTVISGARGGGGMTAKLRAQVNAAHLERASRSPRGRHVVAERSGHYVPITEPAVIVEEIRRLVQDST